MIYDTNTINQKYSNYANISQKIRIEIKKNELIRIRRGLYTDNIAVDSPVIANICYSPSYLSFEYALSYYGLIPEHVSAYTSASFNKKNNKKFISNNFCFEYSSIPASVFYQGLTLLTNEDGVRYKIAVKEKALCDELYSMYPVRSIATLETLLYEDLRLDEEELLKLNVSLLKKIIPLYRCSTLNMFLVYLEEKIHE